MRFEEAEREKEREMERERERERGTTDHTLELIVRNGPGEYGYWMSGFSAVSSAARAAWLVAVS